MKQVKKTVHALLCVTLLGSIVATVSCGSAGSGGSAATRTMTGTISSSSFGGLTRGLRMQTVTSCADTQVCCFGYAGDSVVAEVGSDCSYSLDLPIDNFCFCGLFSGTDSDGDGCGDDYLASMGCSENGYAGVIPVFADSDGTTDAIDTGEVSVEGLKVVSANNICAQVDQDGDGINDAEDTDDDGDSTLDSDDGTDDSGCENALEYDGSDDGIPDLFQPSVWAGLDDEDADDVPDFCDVTSCVADETDADGDCIPDDSDYCSADADGDSLNTCFDCDDSDPDVDVSAACYDESFCQTDTDGDGFGLCDDCDDEDVGSTYECWSDTYCDSDVDGDGFGQCLDCDDSDPDVDVSVACYDSATTEDGSDFCSQDNDGDGVDICSDCDDFDETSGLECYSDNATSDICQVDEDVDGFGYCEDCNDQDDTVTDECFL